MCFFWVFWPVFCFISCLDPSNPCPCSVQEELLPSVSLGELCSASWGSAQGLECAAGTLQGVSPARKKWNLGRQGDGDSSRKCYLPFWSSKRNFSGIAASLSSLLHLQLQICPFFRQHFLVPMTLSNNDVPSGNLNGIIGIIYWI